MITMIIADDEPFIRDSLRTAIPWEEEFGITILGEAKDGQEAYELCMELKPDIMFMDIMMPFLDGLQVAAKLKEADSPVKIIIISGMQDFSYAQNALKVNAEGYILKPVKLADLKEIFRKTVDTLHKERAMLFNLESLKEQLQENKPLIRDKFLQNLLAGLYPEAGEVWRKIEFFEMPFTPEQQFTAAVLQLDDYKKALEKYSEEYKQLLYFSIENIVNEIMAERRSGIGFVSKENEFILLFGLRGGEAAGVGEAAGGGEAIGGGKAAGGGEAIEGGKAAEGGEAIGGGEAITGSEAAEGGLGTEGSGTAKNIEAAREIASVCETCASSISRFLKLSVSVGIGSTYADIRNVEESYKEAATALIYKFYTGPHSIIHIRDIRPDSETLQSSDLYKFHTGLMSALKVGNTDKAAVLLEELFLRLSGPKLQMDYVQNLCSEILFASLRTLYEMNEGKMEMMDDRVTILNEIYGKTEIGQLKTYMLQFFTGLTRYLELKNTTKNSKTINKIKEIIHDGYAGELSVAKIAEQVYLTPNYISQIFKQGTGETISDYITKVRIEQAKELLQHSDLKVMEIAERVGYENPHYFSTVFKKNAGSHPLKYREEAGRQGG
ncbi:response regulator [Paenibacillus sp. CN-4]|uniref:response regulator n=1 Tax=Paenibacillus nanchangensis TaxID=3348343 RepID=UPI00397C34E6